jgi:hypothetical protein
MRTIRILGGVVLLTVAVGIANDPSWRGDPDACREELARQAGTGLGVDPIWADDCRYLDEDQVEEIADEVKAEAAVEAWQDTLDNMPDWPATTP